MSPHLRGATSDTNTNKIKNVQYFIDSCCKATKEDKIKFNSAYKEHLKGNTRIAKKIYQDLLDEYKNDKVIEYNLNLI